MKQSTIFLIGGASAVGSTAIIANLLKDEHNDFNLTLVPRITTRKPRLGESTNTIKSISKEQFEQGIANNEFISWTVFKANNSYYGIYKKDLLEALEQGKNPIIELFLGLKMLKSNPSELKNYKIVSISIEKSSREAIKQQLIKRKTEDSQEIMNRFKEGESDAIYARENSDYNVINDYSNEEATDQIKKIIKKEIKQFYQEQILNPISEDLTCLDDWLEGLGDPTTLLKEPEADVSDPTGNWQLEKTQAEPVSQTQDTSGMTEYFEQMK